MVTAWYMTYWWHQRYLETGFDTWALQKPNQSYQHFNWNSYQPWSNTPYKKLLVGLQLFPLLEIVTQKDVCVASSGTWRLTLMQNGCLCPLSLLSVMTKFSVLMPLQGIAPGNSWIGGVFLKDYKIIWKIKIREMKTK